MKIFGIAVYDVSEKPFKKIETTTEKLNGFFSSYNPMSTLEENVLPNFSMEDSRIYCFYSEKNLEFHYLKALTDQHTVLALVSRQKLDEREAAYLFINIEQIHEKKDLKKTLNDIRDNPLGFTNKSIHISKIQQDINSVKVIMLDNLNKLVVREDQLHALAEKSNHLAAQSIEFNKQATKLNSCC